MEQNSLISLINEKQFILPTDELIYTHITYKPNNKTNKFTKIFLSNTSWMSIKKRKELYIVG